jgi:23S rRNA pseudouridine1911/1915/1917 synthase
LAFDHPITGERLKFETPIPKNFQELVEKWENYSKNFNL